MHFIVCLSVMSARAKNECFSVCLCAPNELHCSDQSRRFYDPFSLWVLLMHRKLYKPFLGFCCFFFNLIASCHFFFFPSRVLNQSGSTLGRTLAKYWLLCWHSTLPHRVRPLQSPFVSSRSCIFISFQSWLVTSAWQDWMESIWFHSILVRQKISNSWCHEKKHEFYYILCIILPESLSSFCLNVYMMINKLRWRIKSPHDAAVHVACCRLNVPWWWWFVMLHKLGPDHNLVLLSMSSWANSVTLRPAGDHVHSSASIAWGLISSIVDACVSPPPHVYVKLSIKCTWLYVIRI